MRIRHALVAVTVAALAGPAIAADAEAKAPQDRGRANATKYCIEYEQVTGSRITKSECLTKAEWAKRGIDVDEVLRR